MERLTEKITNKETGEILAYRLKSASAVDHIKACRKLGELEDAEEQGRLFVLPCKVGDDVYFIPSKVNYKLNILNEHEENNRIYHQKIVRITFTRNEWYVECDKDLDYGTGRVHIQQHFGETWFLTEEEAEAALERMKGERNE
ncbi:MAG: hypothetical protein E7293_03305 [Lachnospiraceae bacterium]|nr:hypothetical protein [Lachnospiraceae bacterium]